MINGLFRKTIGAWCAILFIATACAGTSTESTNAPTASASKNLCAESASAINNDNTHAILFESDLDMVLEQYTIFERECDGMLVLTDGASRFPINQSWRLWEFESARWIDPEAANEIAVTASYMTGIGPTGAQPFRVKIIMHKTKDGWAPSSPVLLADVIENSPIAVKNPKPLPDITKRRAKFNTPRLQIASSLQEYESLIHKKSSALADVSVDFTTERLVTVTIALTSGSMKLRNIRVFKHDTGYELTYDVTRPRIGTADIKLALFYVVLPNDQLSVKAFEHRRDAVKGTRIEAKTGIVNRL